MIEVEQKFILSEKDIVRLIASADFLGEKKFMDTYYDTAEYTLTKNDIWLRKRGDEFELKLPLREAPKSSMQQYQEIEGAEKIRQIFAIVPVSDFESDIKSLGYEPFCVCTTTRKKFKKDEFTIDLDEVSYGDFSYNIAEIELMVDEKSAILRATKKIEKFAEEKKLKISSVRGKIIEYLMVKKPQHYQALVEAGVVRE